MTMPTSETLRRRLQLIAEFQQLQARLEAGDETAIEPATDILIGVSITKDCGTLALVMKALAETLAGFQGELDREGWKYTVQ